MAEYLPVVKVQQGQYLIGSQKLSLSQRGTDCIVSLPSGDVTLEEYYERNARTEVFRLHKAVSDSGSIK